MPGNGPKARARRLAAGNTPDLMPSVAPASFDKKAIAYDRLARYQPARIAEARWAEIGDFVRDVCGQLIDVGMVNLDDDHYRAIAYMASWLRSQALELTVKNLLDPRNVNLFATGLKSRSAPTYQSALRRAGKALKVARRETLRPLDGRLIAAPYTTAEVAEYWRQARLQPTPGRTQTMRASLVLGLGCGLPSRSVVQVRSSHVGYEHGVLGVSACDPERFVPVLALYADELLAVQHDYEDSPTLFGANSRNSSYISDRLSRLSLPSTMPALRIARLRSTWLLHHLSIGTRIPELAAAAALRLVELRPGGTWGPGWRWRRCEPPL